MALVQILISKKKLNEQLKYFYWQFLSCDDDDDEDDDDIMLFLNMFFWDQHYCMAVDIFVTKQLLNISNK